MFSSAWFSATGLSSGQVFKIAAWVGVSLVLAMVAAILLASPLMSVLGMTTMGS